MKKTKSKSRPKTPAPQLEANDYFAMYTVPRAIPVGRVLVHNHIQHNVGTPCSYNGFRAWTQAMNKDKLMRCMCGWSGLPHYKIRPRRIKQAFR